MPFEITLETLFIIVGAIAVFYFLQLLWRIYSDMTKDIGAVYRVNNGKTPKEVYDNSRAVRWNRRIFVSMVGIALAVVLAFFFPEEATTVLTVLWDALQFLWSSIINMIDMIMS